MISDPGAHDVAPAGRRSLCSGCHRLAEIVYSMQNLQQVALHGETYRRLRAQWGFRLQMAQSVNKTVIARYQKMGADHPWFRVQWTKPLWISSRVATIPSLEVNGFPLNTLASGMEGSFPARRSGSHRRRSGFDRGDKLVPERGHATFFGHLSGVVSTA